MSATDMIVRDALPEDRAAVQDLTRRSYAQYATIMNLATWDGLRGAMESALASTEKAHRIVVERDGTIVGSVLLFAPATDAYGGIAQRVGWPQVRMLAVDPTARGLGVGQLLVEECVRRAHADGATAIGLHTSISMATAMRLYTRMGFVRVPEFDFQPEGGCELVEAYRLEL